MKHYITERKFKIIGLIAGLFLAAAVGLGILRNYSDNPFSQTTETFVKSESASNAQLIDYYNKGQEAAKSQTPKQASFIMTGDIMLSRTVGQKIKQSGNVFLPFQKMADILNSTDFNFANYEGAISGNNFITPHDSLVFNVPPDFNQGLSKYNFQIVSLANNHAADQGPAGIKYTKDYLSKIGITGIGTGQDKAEAWQGAIKDINGLKIAFLAASYASANDNGQSDNYMVARTKDMESLRDRVAELRQNADVVVVSMHSGKEYSREPNSSQQEFARAAIDYGADLVVGHHPHWIQTMEVYKNKKIFYSLGNFIFDQEWSQNTKEGLVLKIKVQSPPISELQGSKAKAEIKQIELIPVIIEDYCCTRPATEQESKTILQKINLSENLLF